MERSVEFELNGKKFVIATGKFAKQADGAVTVRYADTIVLVTACASPRPEEGADFFPLTVEYREKAYAAGKIPGGFFKRESKPSEKEILSSRLIDRPIRPLFPDGYYHEVQIIATVISSGEEDSDVLGIVGASAALCLSSIPYTIPIAGVRVARVNGQFIINPTFAEVEQSDLDLVVAGSKDSIVMVEGGAAEVGEAVLLAALKTGHAAIRQMIALQENLISKVQKPKKPIPAVEKNENFEKKVRDLGQARIDGINRIPDKDERATQLEKLIEEIKGLLKEEFPEQEKSIGRVIEEIERVDLRDKIRKEGRRVDGRKLEDIRTITCEAGVLPRTHGSALFTRGQTQSLGIVTLGTKLDEQKIDSLEGNSYKTYYLHYNFPPFSTGEVKFIRGLGRREVGHGHLAERALVSVLPSPELFPYTIRVVSEILESNGSSSMASVCSGSLSLMDAGVPISRAVAGIAMGLIKEGNEYFVLSDILGVEDHLGDMDFKVAGTAVGITSFQMDIKIQGISFEIFEKALNQAQQGRLAILDIMNQAIQQAKPLSPLAPRILSTQVPVDKIRDVIGTGGKVIRNIQEVSGATINIEDDGRIQIYAIKMESAEKAKRMIEEIIAEPEVGRIYEGTVKGIQVFGAFVEILPGREGLLHISELHHSRVNRVEDVVKIGDRVKVKVIEVDKLGKVRLSKKQVEVHG